MPLLVPFDGSTLSEAALERAVEFGECLDRNVVVLAVVPQEKRYLEDRWGETDPETVIERLQARAHDLVPEATFRVERPSDPEDEPFADATMNVVRAIREVANDIDADVIFVGSENAGRVSTPVTSVGAPVSEDPRYDVHIVRHAE
ncbi:universal stress protein [Natrialbaceae archaeon AArc-T1-2]|uniref:universal stress protein n=1 Tax=Natrialbaceae archaeon AArc-T1-2 TaxID=3053904 RepID=UPI00255B1AB8|nr:universal stress protein [Natrialbaceae archaeon AArc-T1-2]WIV68196.1 universal stress protein [Natrialbaceae archaeon AArc-T1-2]